MSTDLRPVIASLVPRAWKPEQALQAVRLLQHAIEAIWWVHGDAMGKATFGELPPVPDPARPDPKRPQVK